MLIKLLVLLFIAGVCGSIAQSLAGANRSGCLASIALGFIGAILGTWIAQQLEHLHSIWNGNQIDLVDPTFGLQRRHTLELRLILGLSPVRSSQKISSGSISLISRIG